MKPQQILESIEPTTYPNVVLNCANGVRFEASMNDRNRKKLDAMGTFPELFIEDYNAHHGMLKSGYLEVVVYLERVF